MLNIFCEAIDHSDRKNQREMELAGSHRTIAMLSRPHDLGPQSGGWFSEPARQIIRASLASVVGTETLMKTTLNIFAEELRLTVLVILLALVCAFVTACHSHAVAKVSASAETPAQTVDTNPLAGMEPALPLDEELITPMETVGASARD